MAKDHQKKEVSEAIEYTLDRGFRIRETGHSSHAAKILLCPLATTEWHSMSVVSIPNNPRNHADKMSRWVDSCEHWTRAPD